MPSATTTIVEFDSEYAALKEESARIETRYTALRETEQWQKCDKEADERLEAHIAIQKATPLGTGIELYCSGWHYKDVIAVNKNTIVATRSGRRNIPEETVLFTRDSSYFRMLYAWLVRLERWPYEVVAESPAHPMTLEDRKKLLRALNNLDFLTQNASDGVI